MYIPGGLITYGPDENCTLALCPVEDSIYEYRPSLAASGAFIGLFAVSLALHTFQAIRWKTWGYLVAVALGCITEIIGYIGRIMLHSNPFSFDGFLIQIICITCAPVFFCAAIYVTLAQTINHLSRETSRFNPNWFFYGFISCDMVSLALQAAGGATSSTSTGSNQSGVDIALAGLGFQVVTLTVFIALGVDYAIRYSRAPASSKIALSRDFKIFLTFLSLAILFILIRCAYRIDELSQGYSGSLITNQGLFIGLEGVMIVLAVFCLNASHPGRVFDRSGAHVRSARSRELT